MGSFLNPGNVLFFEDVNSEIYVDKTPLIDVVNKKIRTKQKCMCVSRPRRFGKTMAMNMLAAYYSRGCDSREFFAGRKITKAASYPEHLNKHNVIRINMQVALSFAKDIGDMLQSLQRDIIDDCLEEYPDLPYRDKDNVVKVMETVYRYGKTAFIILIDEWDCIFREYREDKEAQDKYLDFLRAWLKDQEYVGLV